MGMLFFSAQSYVGQDVFLHLVGDHLYVSRQKTRFAGNWCRLPRPSRAAFQACSRRGKMC